MAFDFKKEYKDLYLPKTKPELIDVPPMSFIAVAGTGNPNEENGSAVRLLVHHQDVEDGRLAARRLLRLHGASA